MSSLRRTQPERRRDPGSGERDGRGHDEKWGKPINGESLRDQPG